MNIKSILQNKKGFTLVELLVSIVIVTIVITVITSYFLAANRISILEQDQRDVQSEARLAMDSILKETRYATKVEVVSVSNAESTTQNAILLKEGKIVFIKNGTVTRTIAGPFTLDFRANGDSMTVDLSSTYRGQTYPLISTFQFPNLQIAKSGVIGANGQAIRYSTNITEYVNAPAPVPTITRVPMGNPTTATSINFTIHFNQPVIGFEETDLKISGVAINSFTTSSQIYSFNMTGIPDGLNALVIPAGVCTNSEGIGNIAASHVFTKGTVGIPTVTVTISNTNLTNQDVIASATGLYCSVSPSSFTFTENGSFTFIGRDSNGIEVASKTIVISNIDKTVPSVTKLVGNNYKINKGTSADLKFSETLASDCISGIETAIRSGTSTTGITFTWNINKTNVTIHNSSTVDHAYFNDVSATIKDLAGNSVDVLLIDKL